jgi:hypothetical protein
MMFLAKELGKTLDEILDLSTLEVRMWAAYFSLENKQQQKNQPTMRKSRRG